MLRRLALVVTLLLIVTGFALPAATLARGPEDGTQRYIITFSSDVFDVPGQARGLGRARGFEVDQTFDTVLKGFAAQLTPAQVQALSWLPFVSSVMADQEVRMNAQEVPVGIQRIGATTNPLAAIDGSDSALNIGIAVLDSGIDLNHPDLRVAGGYNCTTSNTSAYADDNGHGTHVAGTIAARDNGSGVVGVAPGANLYAVKVFDSNGSGYVSWIICGMNWIAQRAATIKAANFSGSWSGTNTANCGNGGFFSSDAAHKAVCNLVNTARVPLIVAAGNDGRDASNTLPAAYPETIAVGALVDTDGLAGGFGPASSYGNDETRASFSNFGGVVDLFAPGVSVVSTWPGGGLATASGTSMAAPHVTGASALYLLANPGSSPSQVRQGLLTAGESGPWASQRLVKVGATTPPPDPDPVHDVAVTSVTATSTVIQGQAASVNVALANNGGFDESVTVSLSSAPANAAGNPAAQTVALGAGQTASVSFTWGTTSETAATSYTLTASAAIAQDATPSNNSKTATVNVTAPAPVESTEMYVQDLAFSGSYRWFSSSISGTVQVRTDTGPVSNATVRVRITGFRTDTTLTATTDGNGIARFSSSVRSRGTYQVAVTSVSRGGYSYNPSRNVESSQSVSF